MQLSANIASSIPSAREGYTWRSDHASEQQRLGEIILDLCKRVRSSLKYDPFLTGQGEG